MTPASAADDGQGIRIGRYLLHRQIARGGMATIHIARLMGDEGFSRIVAAKRLLPELAEDVDFATMFLDEARVASKVHHRNVVPVLDVVATGDDVILIEEYVHGAPLHKLLALARQQRTAIPAEIAVAIAAQVLAGLQAAHDTCDELGTPLGIVHRDVSPQNVMVSVDGTAQLLDFGVAKATMAAHVTRENAFKGKVAYSAPEQLSGASTSQSDVYSLAIVLWELLVGSRIHAGARAEMELVTAIMAGKLPTMLDALAPQRAAISAERWAQLEVLQPIVARGVAVDRFERWASAAEMEAALVAAVRPASANEVAAWLKTLGKELLDKNDRMLAAEEASWRRTAPPVSRPARTHSESRRGGIVRPDSSEPEITIQTPWLRRTGVVIGLAAGLVALLAVAIVFAFDRPARSATPAAAVPIAPTPAPAAAPVIAPAPVVPATTPTIEAAAPVPAPPATTPPAADDAKAAHRHHPRASTAAEPAPAAAAPPPATTPPPAVADCNPPYYFEGTKKIFKAACL